MVRAILDGQKTQARRILRPQPPERCAGFERVFPIAPYFEARDALGNPIDDAFAYGQKARVAHPPLAVKIGTIHRAREVWAHGADGGFVYQADQDPTSQRLGKWCSPLAMPLKATRLFFTVTDIRIQRLQDITDSDAKAEGVADIKAFARLWDKTVGYKAWDANPWVYAISFTPHRATLDQMAA